MCWFIANFKRNIRVNTRWGFLNQKTRRNLTFRQGWKLDVSICKYITPRRIVVAILNEFSSGWWEMTNFEKDISKPIKLCFSFFHTHRPIISPICMPYLSFQKDLEGAYFCEIDFPKFSIHYLHYQTPSKMLPEDIS